MNQFLEIVGGILMLAFLIALLVLFRGEPSLVDAWRAKMLNQSCTVAAQATKP